MPLDLPGPIAEYFTAEKAHDALALAQCFVDDGVVRDEGGTFSGTNAIREPSNPAPQARRLSQSMDDLEYRKLKGAT